MPSEQLLGPLALLVAALLAVGVLWREHLKADQDDRDQRTEAIALLKVALDGNKAMADAWDRRNRADEARRRREDA